MNATFCHFDVDHQGREAPSGAGTRDVYDDIIIGKG
jgi:hypothetical protein